jgi:hypothetical protein
VSTFYVLPPRPVLGDCFARFLQTFFPGLDWDAAGRARLAEVLTAVLPAADLYLVHREDLPPGEPLARALADVFGAEPGDEVVEVRPAGRPGEMTARRWLLGA